MRVQISVLILFACVAGCSDEALVLPPSDSASPSQFTTDASSGSDISLPPQNIGTPCSHASDCSSGLCMEGPDGGLCSSTCTVDCPSGWDCKSVALPPPNADADFACIPSFAYQCRPCAQDEDCRNPFETGSANACVDHGDAGSFCGTGCQSNTCPEGYECATATLTNGGNAPQCVPLNDEICDCRPSWSTLGLLTECATSNALGSCAGLRTCGANGLTECDAPTPSLELCNNQDDDCDGSTDEETCENTEPEPAPTPELNANWIGGPCGADADCDYEGGYCLTESDGFAGGMCSRDCTLYCPDEDGKTTTFCIDETSVNILSEGGICAMQCNFDASATGCREGYQCVNLPRHNDPDTINPTCIPTTEESEPGPSTYLNEGWIGGLCAGDPDCGYESGYCLTQAQGFTDGMCSQDCDLYCPDQEGMTMTFCIDPIAVDLAGDKGLCAMRCDYDTSTTGCRPGYKCADLPRHDDPSTTAPTCIPMGASGTIADPPDASTPVTECQQQLEDMGVYFTIASNPMDSPKDHPELVCDIPDPIYVEGTILGVNYRYDTMNNSAKPIFANCQLAVAMAESSKLLLENDITDVLHLGVYNCRTIGNTSKISQHGLANALDIRALRHSSGQIYTVYDDWEKDTAFPVTTAGSLLKWFVETLYLDWVFNVILTPDHNKAHEDHFHLDLTEGSHFLN